MPGDETSPDLPASSPSATGGAPLTLETVTGQWGDILARLRERSLPVQALINSSRLAGVEGNTLVLSWPSELLKERYENARTKQLVEDVMTEILGQPVHTRCMVASKGSGRPDRLVEEAVKSLGAVVSDH